MVLPNPNVVVVEAFKDGVGNIYNGVQWDGTPETATFIADWTQNRATTDRHGILGIVVEGNRFNVGLNDWLMTDANRTLRIMTNRQVETLSPVGSAATEPVTP